MPPFDDYEDPIDAFSQRITRLSERPEIDADAFSERINRLSSTSRIDVDAFSKRVNRLSEERPYRPDPARVDAIERRRAFIVATQQNYGLDSEAAEELYRSHLEGRKMGFWETGWHNLKEKIDPVLHAEAGRNIVAASRLSKTRYGREIDLDDKTSVIKGGMKASGVFSIDLPPTPEESQKVLDAGFSEPVARMMNLSRAKKFYAKGLEAHRKAEKYTQSARYKQDLNDVDKYFRHQGRLAAKREILGQTTMGKIGGGLSDTAIFMMELYATGGLGGVVSAEAKLGAKAAIKNLLKSAVSPERIVASVGRAAIMPSTATEAMAKIAPHMAVGKEGDVTIKKEGMPYFEAVGGSLIDKAIAVHAEKMGAGFGQVGRAAMRKFPAGRKILAALHKAFKKKHPAGSPQAFAKEFFKRAEFHGLVSESLEERAEDFMRWGLGRQENLLPSLEEWGIELGVLGILKGGQVSLTGGGTAVESLVALGERKEAEAAETEKKFEEAEKTIAAEPDYIKAGEAVEAAATELAARYKADFTYTPDKPLLLSDLVADEALPGITKEVADKIVEAGGLPDLYPHSAVQILGFTTKGNPIIGSKDSIHIAQGGDVYTVVEEVFEANYKNLSEEKQSILRRDLRSYELINGRLTEGNELERLSDLAKAAALDAKLHKKLGYRLKELVDRIRTHIAKVVGNARTLRHQVRAGNVAPKFLKRLENVTYQRAIDQQLEKIASQIQQLGVEPEIEAEVGKAAKPEAAAQLSDKEFPIVYRRYGEVTEKAERNKLRAMTQKETELWRSGKNWEEFSRKQGYTNQEIEDYRYWLELNKDPRAEAARGFEDLPEDEAARLKIAAQEKEDAKPPVKKPLPTEKPIANVFTRMPTDLLETQAKQGVAGAKAELERRKTEGELSASVVRILPPVGDDFTPVKVISQRGIKAQTIGGIKSIGSLISDLITPLSTRLEKISLGLWRRLRNFEITYRKVVKQDLDAGELFAQKMSKLPAEAYKELARALNHSQINKTYEILDQEGIPRSEYHAAQGVLEQIHKDAKEVGIDLGYIEHFWPRAVKEIDELRTFMAEQRKEQYWSAFETAIRQRERETGKKLEGQARIDYINQLIRGYGSNRIQVSGQGHTKMRVLKTLDDEVAEFYYGPEVAWAQYVQQMREAIEARKMFGMGKKSALVEDPIGVYVHKLVEHQAITPEQERAVVDIFTARFNSKQPRKIIRTWRNFEYAETLGSPLVALTQLEDMGIAWYRAGILTGIPRVLSNFAKAALNKSDIRLIDLGIYDIAAEMTDPARTHKVLDFILRITGFKYLDRVGKETTINTIVGTYQKQARMAKPPKDFVRRITRVFGTRAGEVIAAMARGEVNDDVQYLAASEIFDIQPLTLSELPMKYHQMSDGKVFYMLKTFMLRRLDFVLNETVRQIRTNPVQGILNGVRLGFALMVMGVSVDELKDWILGRRASLSDRVTDNLLRTAGFSKYNIYDAKARGGWKAMFSQIAPPFKIVDSAGRDIRDLATGKYKGSESLASIPVVGRILYWWYGKGYEKAKKKRIRERPETIEKILRERLGPKKERTGARRRIE